MTTDEAMQHAKELLDLRAKIRVLQERLHDALAKHESSWTENLRLKKRVRELERIDKSL